MFVSVVARISSLEMKYDNYTRYGIHDKTERYLLSAYTSFIFLSSVIGDTLILIGSMKYNAIKLHKIMVVFIRYMAVGDLVISIFRVLPGAVSLIANDWIFGNILCSASFFMTCIFGGTCCCLISALAFAKFLIVKYPFRAVHFSRKVGHLTTLVIWAIWSCIGVVEIYERGAFFSYMSYNCDYFNNNRYSIAFGVILGGVGIIATAITIVSSLMLLFLAKKIADRRTGGLQWQGVRTVLLTVVVYVLATVPFAVSLLESTKTQARYDVRFAEYIAYLNTISNFYIYTISVTGFRDFLKSRIRIAVTLIGRCFVPKPVAMQERERERLLP